MLAVILSGVRGKRTESKDPQLLFALLTHHKTMGAPS